MMWPVNLPAERRGDWLAALRDGTEKRTTVALWDLNERPVADVSDLLVDAQVNIVRNESGGPERTLQISFRDPDHTLGFDGDTATDGFSGLRRLIAPVQHVLVPGWGWARTPMGVYRPQKPSSAATLDVEAWDKSALHLVLQPVRYIPAGVLIVTAIRDVLYAFGERRFNFPAASAIAARTTKRMPYGGGDDNFTRWKVLQRLARSHGWQLYMDLLGRPTLRKAPTRNEGVMHWDASTMTEVPSREGDLSLRNRLYAVGKGKARASRALPSGDLLSEKSLALNGVPWTNMQYAEQTDLGQRDLDKWANAEIGRQATQEVASRLSCRPLYGLDPGDYGSAEHRGKSFAFPIHDCSTPLGGAGSMTIGVTTSVRNATAGR